jgi:hypothetical protein
VNLLRKKVKSSSAGPELLASSFDPRLCDEKSGVAVLVRIAPELPFMAPINPGRLAGVEP